MSGAFTSSPILLIQK